MSKLRASNPAYNENIAFVRVDWDTYSRAEITKSYNVPRRSTLILIKGGNEAGRIVASTSESSIKSLLDKGL